MKPKSLNGFTLIELLIAVAIVAVLTAAAVPSYTNYVMQSRRPDAKQALLDLAAREERYYTVNNTYTSSAIALGYVAPFPASLGSSPGDYSLSVTNASATAYSLQAAPTNSQAHDTCGTYTLDNLGNQGAGASNCW
jgi:type IV pilus assembly protein PilE